MVSRVPCTPPPPLPPPPTEGRVGSCVRPLKHDRVRPASVSSALHQELHLSPWTDNVRRGRVYFSGYSSSRPHPSFLPLPSTMNQRRRLVGLRYLFLVTLSLAKLLCFLGGGLVSFSFPFNRRFEVSE